MGIMLLGVVVSRRTPFHQLDLADHFGRFLHDFDVWGGAMPPNENRTLAETKGLNRSLLVEIGEVLKDKFWDIYTRLT